MNPRRPFGHGLAPVTPQAEEEVERDIPGEVLGDLMKDYERDKPRRDAEAKILWNLGKEKGK